MRNIEDNILSVEDLRVIFETHHGDTEAVRGVSFTIPRGKTVALVGESGSGKSVTSYSILRLIQPPGRIASGNILFRPANGMPIDLARLDSKSEALYKIRGGKISMIFQEPMTALSPVHTIGNQITEAILLHQKCSKSQAYDIAESMLARVGISEPRRRLHQYPFEFSGGMRQRVVIAMALVCQPELLIADEPSTALDVTVQAQILRLINDLRKQMGTSVLFITHDLGVVAQIADEVAVMRHGRIVEKAPVRELYRSPIHPYTRDLLAAASFENVECKPVDFVMPTGLQFDVPAEVKTSPTVHQVNDNHELLLWPALEGT